jgi:hypothetical protein
MLLHEVSSLIPPYHRVKQRPVENLWIDRAKAVDEATAKIFFEGAIDARTGCASAFADRFA